jgi:hypothetical protein
MLLLWCQHTAIINREIARNLNMSHSIAGKINQLEQTGSVLLLRVVYNSRTTDIKKLLYMPQKKYSTKTSGVVRKDSDEIALSATERTIH